MLAPLIITTLAGSATLIGAVLGVITKKPSNRLLAFSLGFAAGVMLLISLMEMVPNALKVEGMTPLLGYGMFVVGLLGYYSLDYLIPHEHPQDLRLGQLPIQIPEVHRTAFLLTLGISLHNFPEGIATYVTTNANFELGIGVAIAIAMHNIPEGLAIAGPVYAATGSKGKALFFAGISGFVEVLGGLFAFFILGPEIQDIYIAAIMALVAGIMVALSVDELMPTAQRIDPFGNPSYGVLCGIAVMGFCLTFIQ